MPPQKKSNPNDYDASKIETLTPREHIRKRPGMYIGGVDKRALHQIVFEVLNDPISEFEIGGYNEITIILLPDRIISIVDDGVGIPLQVSNVLGISMLELHLTQFPQRAFGRPNLNPQTYQAY